jgi:manganese-dependent inorganic pyrophosphatase
MNENRIRALPILGDNYYLTGIVTMKDIAMNLIFSDNMEIDTTYDNMLEALGGKALSREKEDICGLITVTAFHTETIIRNNILNSSSIVIVGDRYEIIKHAVEKEVELIIITGGREIPEKYIEEAKNKGINIIMTENNTYQTTKIISFANKVESIMVKEKDIEKLYSESYLEDFKELLSSSGHSKFPVTDKDGKYLGILSRRHIIKPSKKKVILVDHNELEQSAEGIEEAEILEVVDHHKIGSIATTLPIRFRNEPVGSTNTIIYELYKEKSIDMPNEIAGLVMSGIISDTLFFKSPTTTIKDKNYAHEIAGKIGINIEKYAFEMFRAGTSIEGMTQEEIFYSDYKEFEHKSVKFGISQVFTLDIDKIIEDEESTLELLKKKTKEKEIDVIISVFTDILKEGSYVIGYSEIKGILKSAFKIGEDNKGVFLEGVVSRKKQIVPKIMDGIEVISI